MSLKCLRFIALVSVTHLVAQVLCGVQTLLVFLRGCRVYYTGLGLNVNRDTTRLKLSTPRVVQIYHLRMMLEYTK